MRVFGLGVLAVTALMVPLSTAAAQGVRYTLAPSAERVYWDDGLPLEDRTAIGGRLGVDFGRLVGLSAFYHRSDELPLLLEGVEPKRIEYSTFGANLLVKLGTGKIVPFASLGAGVMQFNVPGQPVKEFINYRYGGGLQLDLAPGIRAQALLEDSRVRLDQVDFEDGASLLDGEATLRSNWTLGVALGVALGGGLDGSDPGADNWSLASLPIEPFAGRLDWDDAALGRQAVAGVRTGIDLGTRVGLRGFYWQGRSDGLGDRQPIQGYGAEAQFNFARGIGAAPYLVIGGARIDFEDGFLGNDSLGRDDVTALVVGGGVSLRLTDQFRLNVSARDYLTADRRLDDARTLSELQSNWMFSAGIGFDIGRHRRRATLPPTRTFPGDDFVSRDIAADRPMPVAHPEVRDTIDAGRRMIMVPVPEVGEIILRYGMPGRTFDAPVVTGHVATDSMLPRHGASGLDSLMSRLVAVLDSMLTARGVGPDAVAPVHAAPAVRAEPVAPREAVETRPEPVAPREAVEAMPARVERAGPADVVDDGAPTDGISVHQIAPYGGMSFGGGSQLVGGVQADIGQVFVPTLRLVPEAALGFGGEGRSFLAALGVQLALPTFKLNATRLITPHVRLGVGTVWRGGDADNRSGITLAYGVTFARVGDNGSGSRLFVEHQGVDGFGIGRLVAGFRWTR